MMNQEQSPHLSHWPVTHATAQHTSATPPHLGQLLHAVSGAFQLRTLAKCHQRGHRKFRNSHSAVIARLDSVGLCLGDLAERIGITQQATGKLVRDLERAGYVDSHLDSRDKRSRIIHLTAAGAALQQDMAAALHEVEDEFLSILGERGMRSFEQQLRSAANAFT